MSWEILIGSIILSYVIGCIAAVIISNHIETYCKKISVNVGEAEPKSLFGFPIPKSEKREILDNYVRHLSLIYTIVAFAVLIFIYYG